MDLFYYDDLRKQIFNYIDFYDIMNLNEALNYTISKEAIYWRSLQDFKILLHESYLLKMNLPIYMMNNYLSFMTT